jgi:radial spoke head protein 9
MNADDLFIKLNYLGPNGQTLNIEQKAALQTSLPLLKKNSKFDRVIFWGKIVGLQRDYLIAQGFGTSLIGTPKSFCRLIPNKFHLTNSL